MCVCVCTFYGNRHINGHKMLTQNVNGREDRHTSLLFSLFHYTYFVSSTVFPLSSFLPPPLLSQSLLSLSFSLFLYLEHSVSSFHFQHADTRIQGTFIIGFNGDFNRRHPITVSVCFLSICRFYFPSYIIILLSHAGKVAEM